MLIVVAIIAILIAISIPLISNALKRAKHSTDAANERAAKAVVLIASLNGDEIDDTAFSDTTVYYYDAQKGELKESFDDVTSYGQHHEKGIIAIGMDGTTVKMQWVTTAFTGTPAATSLSDTDLCNNTDINGTGHPAAPAAGSGGGTV